MDNFENEGAENSVGTRMFLLLSSEANVLKCFDCVLRSTLKHRIRIHTGTNLVRYRLKVSYNIVRQILRCDKLGEWKILGSNKFGDRENFGKQQILGSSKFCRATNFKRNKLGIV